MKPNHEKRNAGKLGAYDLQWEMQFYELQKFKKKYGHCDVSESSKNKKYRSLAWWCNTQRKLKKFSPPKYSPDRLNKLNRLGFSWSIQDKLFEKKFLQLKQYHEKHGHCNVRRSENQRLAEWCYNLRRENKVKVSTLSKERISRLTKLGFTWEEGIKSQWEKQFARLEEFKNKYGHCNVSRSRKSNTYMRLSNWAKDQRLYYRNKSKRLTTERIAKLNSLDFNWVNPLKIGKGHRIKEHFLINEMRRLNSICGNPPTAKFINEHGKYSAWTYYNRFGSIGKARKAAGINSGY